jgi:glycosyltransferase involved in cell wall biosynthesis
MVLLASGLLRRRAPRPLVRGPSPSAGPCRILFFGTYDSRRYQSVRVLLDGLVARGHDVTECNEPLRFSTAARVRLLRQPWRLPAFAIRLLLAWVRLWLRARRLPPADVVVVGYMGHFDVHLARRLFRKTPIVLDHLVSAQDTAIDRRSGSGSVLRILGVLDRAALRTADVIVVDTPEHRAMLPEDVRDRATVVAVGTPEPWFWPPRRSQAPVLRAVFFGSFTPLQGAPVIGEALGLLADDEKIAVTVLGSGQDSEATRRAAAGNPHVTWIDWVEPEALPYLVSSHDVCLGVFGDGPKAYRVVPSKVFQGAAAGAAIITSDTPPQRAALGEDAVFVSPADPHELAAALRALASDRDRLWSLQNAAYDRADTFFRPRAVVAGLCDDLAAVVRSRTLEASERELAALALP